MTSFYLPKQAPKLEQAISAEIRTMYASGEMAKLIDKWGGDPREVPHAVAGDGGVAPGRRPPDRLGAADAMTLTALFEVEWSDYTSDLGSALLKTLEFTVAGFAGAALLGLVLALMRLSPARALRIPAAIYTELFKNIPLLAIIFLTYFGLPSQGIRLNVFPAGTLSLVVFYAAYLSEIFRAGDRRRARRPAGGAPRRSA